MEKKGFRSKEWSTQLVRNWSGLRENSKMQLEEKNQTPLVDLDKFSGPSKESWRG